MPEANGGWLYCVQHHVVGHGEGTYQTVFLPVLRDVGHAGPEPLGGRGVGQVLAAQRDPPRGGGPQPHQRLAQLGLPVALHPGHAQDLARPDLEGHPVHPDPAGLVGHGQVGHVEDHLAGLGRLLADPQLHIPADHQGGEFVLGGRRGRSPTTAPRRSTVIVSAMAWTSLSLCEMNTTDVPPAVSCRMIRNRSSVSSGVSTAVGSSRISTVASLTSALTISTRCWMPTGRFSTSASGSISSP